LAYVVVFATKIEKGRVGSKKARASPRRRGEQPKIGKGKISETYANLGWVGMATVKSFGILVGG
jgi:hypothetical protein